MFKKSISIILIFAFLNFSFLSCVKRTEIDIPIENIVAEDEEKIIEVIMPNGIVIQFKNLGANYWVLPERVAGISVSGQEKSIDVSQIIEIRTATPEVVSGSEFDPQKITEVITLQNSCIRIDGQGTHLMADKITYQSKTADGIRFNFRKDNTKEIRTGQAKTISISELKNKPGIQIKEIIYREGESEKIITFDQDGGRFFEQRSGISGIDDNGKQMNIDINDILYVRVERGDSGATCIATVGCLALGVVGAFLIVLATKESCPFVYSYNGNQYVFDAEPLGGAISKGLKKVDFSKLEHLESVNNKYKLLFRNEVEEIQYLDEVKLLIIDYDPNFILSPDMLGNFYAQKDPIVSSSALDEKNIDLSPFVNQKDNIVWQTHLPVDSTFKNNSLRHQLTFEFPKPTNAKYAKLIINAGTALWGSNMIREMIQLRGDGLDQWYEGINNHANEFNELYSFIDREELYSLQIYIENNRQWLKNEHNISGGGPLITEDKIIPLDVSNLSGDKLRIRLNPPIGFWTIDYIAVEYEFFKTPKITEIKPKLAINQDGEQVQQSLQSIDQNYCQMFEVGDWFTVEFDAPPLKEDLKRTVYLKTYGYYEIQVDKTQPEKTELIQYLLNTPDAIVEYSMDEYLKWRENLLTSN